MVEFNLADLREAMARPEHIRCVTLLGERGHGKTALLKLLVEQAGVKPTKDAHELRKPPCSAANALADATAAEHSDAETLAVESSADAQAARSTMRLDVHTLFFRPREAEADDSAVNGVGALLGLRGRAGNSKLASAALGTSRRTQISGGILGAIAAHKFAHSFQEKRDAKSSPSPPLRTNCKPGPGLLEKGGYGQLNRAGTGRRVVVTGDVPSSEQEELQDDDDDELETELESALLCYVVDTPGHADFVAEAAAALRLSDGAFLVVDAIEGVSEHLEALLRRAVAERLKLVLVVTGVDRCLPGGLGASCRMGAQKLEALIRKSVQAVNSIAASCPDELSGTSAVGVQPERGELLFGSASQGWMFSLPLLADQISWKYGLKRETLTQRLWDEVGQELPLKSVPACTLAQGTDSDESMATLRKKRATLVNLNVKTAMQKGRRSIVQAPVDESLASKQLDQPERGSRGSVQSRRRRSSSKAKRSTGTRGDIKQLVNAAQGAAMPEELLQAMQSEQLRTQVSGNSAESSQGEQMSRSSSQDVPEVDRTQGTQLPPAPSLLRSIILEPLVQLSHVLLLREWQLADAMLQGLGLPLISEEDKALEKEALLARILSRFARGNGKHEVLSQLLLRKMPSPVKAQGSRGRAEHLLIGAADSRAAGCLYNCSPSGPSMTSITRLMPARGGDRVYALGRVFCGTLTSGQQVRVDSTPHLPGEGHNMRMSARAEALVGDSPTTAVDELVLPLGGFLEPLASSAVGPAKVPAGNIVLLTGPASFLLKAGTLVEPSLEEGVTLANLHLGMSVRPRVRVSVRPASAADLPLLVAALRRLSSADPAATCRAEEWGEHVISGVGEAHLDACLTELQTEMARGSPEAPAEVKLIIGKPGGHPQNKGSGAPSASSRPYSPSCSHKTSPGLSRGSPALSRLGASPSPAPAPNTTASWTNYSVPYRETVRGASGQACKVDCSDGLPALGFEATAATLGERLCTDLEEGLLHLGDRPWQRGLLLAERYGWKATDGRHVWCFGPEDGCGTNAFLDFSSAELGSTGSGASFGSGAWPAVQASCRWAAAEGALCEEPLRGVRFALALRSVPRATGSRQMEADEREEQQTDENRDEGNEFKHQADLKEVTMRSGQFSWPLAATSEAAAQHQQLRRILGAASHSCLLASQLDAEAIPSLQEPMVKVEILLHSVPHGCLAALRPIIEAIRGVELLSGWQDELPDPDPEPSEPPSVVARGSSKHEEDAELEADEMEAAELEAAVPPQEEHFSPDHVWMAPTRLTAELPALEAIGLESRLNSVLGALISEPESRVGLVPAASTYGAIPGTCRLRVQASFSRWATLPGSLDGDDIDSWYHRQTVLGLRSWRQLTTQMPTQLDYLQTAICAMQGGKL